MVASGTGLYSTGGSSGISLFSIKGGLWDHSGGTLSVGRESTGMVYQTGGTINRQGSGDTVLTFKGAAGLWRQDRWKPIIAGGVNLAVRRRVAEEAEAAPAKPKVEEGDFFIDDTPDEFDDEDEEEEEDEFDEEDEEGDEDEE